MTEISLTETIQEQLSKLPDPVAEDIENYMNALQTLDGIQVQGISKVSHNLDGDDVSMESISELSTEEIAYIDISCKSPSVQFEYSIYPNRGFNTIYFYYSVIEDIFVNIESDIFADLSVEQRSEIIRNVGEILSDTELQIILQSNRTTDLNKLYRNIQLLQGSSISYRQALEYVHQDVSAVYLSRKTEYEVYNLDLVDTLSIYIDEMLSLYSAYKGLLAQTYMSTQPIVSDSTCRYLKTQLTEASEHAKTHSMKKKHIRGFQ